MSYHVHEGIGYVNKDEAEAEIARLQALHPEKDYRLGVTVRPFNPDEFERLYAMAANMLTASQVNPMKISLRIENAIGEVVEWSAVRIMYDARTAIDMMGNVQ